MTEAEALAAIDDMFGGDFGAAGAEVVIEEFMTGEEASFFILTDGTNALPIGTAQDHKRVGDGDTGPNTGGMGAYSPAPVLTDAIAAAGDGRDRPAHDPRDGPARHALSGRPLRRADDRGRPAPALSNTTPASATPKPRS